jgi:hypothetical protein
VVTAKSQHCYCETIPEQVASCVQGRYHVETRNAKAFPILHMVALHFAECPDKQNIYQ